MIFPTGASGANRISVRDNILGHQQARVLRRQLGILGAIHVSMRNSEQRKFVMDVLAEALGQSLTTERKVAKAELEASVRSLKLELAEVLTVVHELRATIAAECADWSTCLTRCQKET